MRTARGKQTVGAKLIAVLVAKRKLLGITQHELAHMMGVTQAVVGEYETHMIDPRVSTLVRYGDAVGLKLAWVQK